MRSRSALASRADCFRPGWTGSPKPVRFLLRNSYSHKTVKFGASPSKAIDSKHLFSEVSSDQLSLDAQVRVLSVSVYTGYCGRVVSSCCFFVPATYRSYVCARGLIFIEISHGHGFGTVTVLVVVQGERTHVITTRHCARRTHAHGTSHAAVAAKQPARANTKAAQVDRKSVV